MKDQYADPEAHERWCDEADYRRDEIRDNLWEAEQNKKNETSAASGSERKDDE